MTSVVLDTNVLVSANLRDSGLEALIVALALNRKVQLYVSEPIFQEYRQVLLYPRLKFVSREVERFLARLKRTSIVVTPTHRVSASPDEADNRFLECAEAASADYLVTGIKKHFPKRWKTTQVVNARELLAEIGESFLT